MTYRIYHLQGKLIEKKDELLEPVKTAMKAKMQVKTHSSVMENTCRLQQSPGSEDDASSAEDHTDRKSTTFIQVG